MSDRERVRRPKADSASTRIEWARSLTNDQMDALLQEALLKTRMSSPRTHDVVLLEEIVHELKSRLGRYDEVLGPAPDPNAPE